MTIRKKLKLVSWIELHEAEISCGDNDKAWEVATHITARWQTLVPGSQRLLKIDGVRRENLSEFKEGVARLLLGADRIELAHIRDIVNSLLTGMEVASGTDHA